MFVAGVVVAAQGLFRPELIWAVLKAKAAGEVTGALLLRWVFRVHGPALVAVLGRRAMGGASGSFGRGQPRVDVSIPAATGTPLGMFGGRGGAARSAVVSSGSVWGWRSAR